MKDGMLLVGMEYQVETGLRKLSFGVGQMETISIAQLILIKIPGKPQNHNSLRHNMNRPELVRSIFIP